MFNQSFVCGYMTAYNQRNVVFSHLPFGKPKAFRLHKINSKRHSHLSNSLYRILAIGAKVRTDLRTKIFLILLLIGYGIMLPGIPHLIALTFLRMPPKPPFDHIGSNPRHRAIHGDQIVPIFQPPISRFLMKKFIRQNLVFILKCSCRDPVCFKDIRNFTWYFRQFLFHQFLHFHTLTAKRQFRVYLNYSIVAARSNKTSPEP